MVVNPIDGPFMPRRIPVEAIGVDAARLRAAHEFDRLPAWLQSAMDDGRIVFYAGHNFIRTSRGIIRAEQIDWLVSDRAGIRPCAPLAFAQMYEPA